MREVEYLLTTLAEECAETAKAASKANRYGMHSVNPKTGLFNAQEIIDEYHDIAATLSVLRDRGYLPPFEINYQQVQDKKDKLLREMQLHPGGIQL